MAGIRTIDIARLRLVAQSVFRPTASNPRNAVRRMMAMQGQDLSASLWAVGVRTTGATEAEVRAAFDRREIVRGWPMRGTLHVTTPDDLRLILPLSRHRLATSFSTRQRELGIDTRDIATAHDVAIGALADRPMLRKELFASFEAAGQPTAGQRGAHLIGALAHSGLICLGPFVGAEQAFVLFDEWAPAGRPQLDREEAIAEVALRYFVSHGPATVADLAWWANLTLGDVRPAAALVADRLATITAGGTTYYAAQETVDLVGTHPGSRSVHVLPGFDENLLGYTDRSAGLSPAHSRLIVPGNNGVFKATIVAGGRVAGTWARAEKPSVIQVTASPFSELSGTQRSALVRAVRRYGAFKGKAAELTVRSGEPATATL